MTLSVFAEFDSSPLGIDPRFFERGGRVDVARELYPDAPEPWLDLSTAISPWSYPCPEPPASDLRMAPDAAALKRLTDAAKRAYRAPSIADAVPTPGAGAALGILPWLFREPKRVAILSPVHAGHAAAWESAGHSVSAIESLDRLGKAAILVAVNPSHADGRLIPHAGLAAALAPLKRRSGLLIVDETFADADPSHSLLPEVARLDYTLVLRSLGPFFGAAGVGVGFAITSHPIASRLRAALGASPLSAQALAFGEAALAGAAWIEAQRARLKEAAAAMDAVLEGGGLRLLGGASLFRTAGTDAQSEAFQRLASKGVLARPLADRGALRFGLASREEDLSRLRTALQSA